MILTEGNKKKNHLQRKSAPSYSENSSGDVQSSSLSSATDTLQTSKIADAKIINVTKSAKHNIQSYRDGDFKIDYTKGYNAVIIRLRKLLRLAYEGGSNYAKYATPNGVFSFRLSDHNANGNNFKPNEINVSVYVAFHEYDIPESKIKYKEFKILPETFNNKPKDVAEAIIYGVENAINGSAFTMDKQIAKEDGYPKTNENNNSETETISNIEETMKGYYMCSLEGEEARIAYEKLTHSYTSENYGEEIAKYLIKKNGNIAEPNLENIMDKVIWKNDKLVLVYDEYDGYFSLYKLPGLETESLKHRNVIKLTESDLKRVISESVKKVLNEEEINGLQWETIVHIRKLCAIESMAHRIRVGFSDYLYGGMTYDGGYFNGLQDNKLSPYMRKLMDVAVSIEHIAQERLDEYDEEVVRKVIKMTDPDALQGYL